MIPEGYRRILLADTQRALQWERGLQRKGIAALRIESTGPDAQKGTWTIVVPAPDEHAAKAFVTAVLNDREGLPQASIFPAWGLKALLAALALVAALLVLAYFGE